VRTHREQLGLSQEQLAERADLHWTYISGIERGRRNPGLNILASLAKALNVTLPTLVTDLRPRTRITVRQGRPPRRSKTARG
jgi:transcriptional regulator with XRE-family HTH domain